MVEREEIIRQAKFIVEKHATVRQVAQFFGIPKSTVHSHITNNLFYIDYSLYEKVRKILDQNRAERHIRGGLAIKAKFETMKKI